VIMHILEVFAGSVVVVGFGFSRCGRDPRGLRGSFGSVRKVRWLSCGCWWREAIGEIL